VYALQPFVTTVVYKAVLCAQIIYLGKRRPLRLGLGQGEAGAIYNGLKPWAIVGVNHIVFNRL
jgi:hypothetical protein